MPVSDGQLEQEVLLVCQQLQAVSNSLAKDGLLTASGVVLMGLQTIRALYTLLRPPAVAAGEPTSDPVAPPAAHHLAEPEQISNPNDAS